MRSPKKGLGQRKSKRGDPQKKMWTLCEVLPELLSCHPHITHVRTFCEFKPYQKNNCDRICSTCSVSFELEQFLNVKEIRTVVEERSTCNINLGQGMRPTLTMASPASYQMYAYIYLYTYIHIYTHIYTYIHIYAHIYTYIHIYTHIYTYIHIYIDTYIHIYTHINIYK